MREVKKPAQIAFIFALSLTALAVVELIFPFRPRWNDWFITKMLRSSLGPEGPALIPFTTAVFLYAYSIGSIFGSTKSNVPEKMATQETKIKKTT